VRLARNPPLLIRSASVEQQRVRGTRHGMPMGEAFFRKSMPK